MSLTRPIPALVALSLLVGTESLAQGIDLSWNDCVGPGAAHNRVFNCSGPTNEQYSLYLQFKSPVDYPDFAVLTAIIDLYSDTPTPLTPFWHYEEGGCNRAPLSGISVSDAIPRSCVDACYADPWGRDGSEGVESIAFYLPDYPSLGRGKMILFCYRDPPIPIKAMVNYFALRLQFSTRNRALCAGCDEKKDLVFVSAVLESNDGRPGLTLTNPDKLSNCAVINGGPGKTSCAVKDGCPPFCLLATNPCDPVPARPSTWGSIKILYR